MAKHNAMQRLEELLQNELKFRQELLSEEVRTANYASAHRLVSYNEGLVFALNLIEVIKKKKGE